MGCHHPFADTGPAARHLGIGFALPNQGSHLPLSLSQAAVLAQRWLCAVRQVFPSEASRSAACSKCSRSIGVLNGLRQRSGDTCDEKRRTPVGNTRGASASGRLAQALARSARAGAGTAAGSLHAWLPPRPGSPPLTGPSAAECLALAFPEPGNDAFCRLSCSLRSHLRATAQY